MDKRKGAVVIDLDGEADKTGMREPCGCGKSECPEGYCPDHPGMGEEGSIMKEGLRLLSYIDDPLLEKDLRALNAIIEELGGSLIKSKKPL